MAFPLRIGIIGAGRRGQRRLETLARLSGVLPAGVLDIDGERAGAAGGAFQVPVVPSANELFDQSDAVVIASTRRDRGLLAEHAVRAGLHVFLEAPATTSVDDAERLLSLAEEANVRIGVGASHRFLPLRSVLPARWRPTLAVYHAAGLPADEWPLLLDRAVDWLRTLLRGEGVRRIEAEPMRASALADAHVFGLRFANGRYAQAMIRRHAPEPAENLWVAAADREAEIDVRAGTAWTRIAGAEPGPPSFARHTLPEADPVHDELAQFVRSVQDNVPAPVPLLDALQSMRTAERVRTRLRRT